MHYGKHLLVEVITKNPKELTNKKLIKKVFEQIVKAVKITPVLQPVIYQFPNKPNMPKNIKGGLTAFYIIAESHLAIHTWPENNYFAFDLFSCKNFSEKVVIQIIKNNFSIKKLFVQSLERGLKINFRI
ncbi:MAG: adenosylmethionine decarboxylase [Parcubacteria group bacterium]|nr:adenosylmethionine decarboxylase [Parcubacteria group bacterium]